MNKHARTCEISRVHLQMTTSELCGAFSAVALVELSRGKNLRFFLSNFSHVNRYLNDLIIKNMTLNNCVNKFAT